VKLLHWHTKFYKIWKNVSKVEMGMLGRAHTQTHTHPSMRMHLHTIILCPAHKFKHANTQGMVIS